MPVATPSASGAALPWQGISSATASFERVSYQDAETDACAALPPASLKRSIRPQGPARAREICRPHDRIVALQRADGSWDLTREFAAAIGQGFEDLETALAGAAGDDPVVRRALATALAIAWLEQLPVGTRDECGVAPFGGASWAQLADGVLG
jgi:hypothetical protein